MLMLVFFNEYDVADLEVDIEHGGNRLSVALTYLMRSVACVVMQPMVFLIGFLLASP